MSTAIIGSDRRDVIPLQQNFAVTHIDDYMQKYGAHLGYESRRALRPLHDPNTDKPLAIRLKIPLFPAQGHVVSAAVKAMENGQSGLFISGEMGTGKTKISLAIAEVHASLQREMQVKNGHAYRALIFCPGQLVPKWGREIMETVPNAHVVTIEKWDDIIRINTKIGGRRPARPTYYVISRDRAKLSAKWVPVYSTSGKDDEIRCCQCGNVIKDEKDRPIEIKKLHKNKLFCAAQVEDADGGGRICNAPLWSYVGGNSSVGIWPAKKSSSEIKGAINRWEPAKYIHKHMNGFFDYLVVDECFPGGTPIATPEGSTAIDKLLPGDMVRSMDASGSIVDRRVMRVLQKRKRSDMIRVTFDHGSVVCTAGHRFYVGGTKVEAGLLKSGDELTLYAQKEMQDMPQGIQYEARIGEVLRAGVPCGSHADGSCSVDRAALRSVWKGIQEEAVRASQKVLQPSVLHRGQERHEPAQLPDVRHLVSLETSRSGVLQQRVFGLGSEDTTNLLDLREYVLLAQTDAEILHHNMRAYGHSGHSGDSAAAGVARYLRADYGASPECGQPSVETTVREDRLGAPRLTGSNRIGWTGASEGLHCREGSPEGGGAKGHGLGGCAVLELGHPDEPCGLHGDSRVAHTTKVISVEKVASTEGEWVYDLEVETDHRYFANGVLVSNCHEEKSPDSAQANAVGALVAATKYHLLLSGTICGGYANHVRPLIWRVNGGKMQRLGYNWASEMPFNRDYGRIETTVRTTDGSESGASNSSSRGSKTTKTERVRPGIMPTIFGDLLMEQCVFLGLAEISENLPTLEEKIVGVDMTVRQKAAYDDMAEELAAVVKDMVAKGDRRLLATMLQCLLCWPDYPFDWNAVGYWERPKPGSNPEPMTKEKFIKSLKEAAKTGNERAQSMLDGDPAALGALYDEMLAAYGKAMNGTFIPVTEPVNLPRNELYPKEKALLELLQAEIEQGRQCWVYVQYTGKRDVSKRIVDILRQNGITAKHLPASVSPDKREEWIAKYGRENQVIVSHPKLVETGLDLFDKNGGHNFATLIFYETGYNTFTLRQASRRSWRIGQTKHCKIFYFYYNGTMQSQAMELMGKKLTASLAMEGKFSSEGLAAMGADDGGIEMALAKKLSALEQADEGHTARAWEKIQGGATTHGQTLAETVKQTEARIEKETVNVSPQDALREIEEYLASITLTVAK